MNLFVPLSTNEARRCPATRPLLWLPVLALLAVPWAEAASSAVAPYRLQAGDVINIQVMGHPEWSLEGVIRPDGRLSYPGLGELEIAGRSIAELTAAIADALGPSGRHLRNPQVVINTTSLRPRTISVLGAISRPGSVEVYGTGQTARSLLAQVGGSQTRANLREVFIYRADQSRQSIDLQAQLAGQAPDTILGAGDMMVVPEANDSVGVIGSVARAGEVMLRPGQSNIDLLELVVKVGGLGSNADKERALILRTTGAVEPVALERVLQRQAPAAMLNAGDVLWVLPQPDTQYFVVTGAVNNPGRFEYRQDLTLADALALAGQPVVAADNSNMILIHKDGTKTTLDLRPMLQGKNMELATLPVKPNDIIVVPVQHETYALLGAIGRPGPAPWEENLRLAEALARAGGPVERVSDLAHTVLVRRVEGGKKPVVMELDVRNLLIGKGEEANVLLLPGDTIYIPSLRERTWRDKIDIPMFLLGVAGTIHNIFPF